MVDIINKHYENILYKELSVILLILKIPIKEHKDVINQLIIESSHALYEPIIRHLFIIDDKCDFKIYWLNLLEYRKQLITMYGDRASLYISAYFLSRDNEAKRNFKIKNLKGTELTAKITMRELKSWWERNDQTGLYQNSIIEESINQLCFYHKNNLSQIGIILFKLFDRDGNSISINQYSQNLIEICRCRDIVGHYFNDSYIIILPEGGQAGIDSIFIRLSNYLGKIKEHYNAFHSIKALCGINGNEGESIMMHLNNQLNKLDKKKTESIVCIGKINPFDKWFSTRIKQPIQNSIKHPIKVSVFIILIVFSFYAFNKLNVYFNPNDSWVILNESHFNTNNEINGWKIENKKNTKPLKKSDDLISRNQKIILSSSNDFSIVIPIKSHQNVLKIDLSISIELNSESVLIITDQNNKPVFTLNLNHQYCKILTQSGQSESITLPYFPANYFLPIIIELNQNNFHFACPEINKTFVFSSEFKNSRALHLSQKRGTSRVKSLIIMAGSSLKSKNKKISFHHDLSDTKVQESNLTTSLDLLKNKGYNIEAILFIFNNIWASPNYTLNELSKIPESTIKLEELFLLSKKHKFENSILFFIALKFNKDIKFLKKYNLTLMKSNAFKKQSSINYAEYYPILHKKLLYNLFKIKNDQDSCDYILDQLKKQNLNFEIKKWAQQQ